MSDELPLRWTTETPTVPGMYWFRPRGKEPRIVRVTERTIQSQYGVGAEWAGPLPEPEEGA